MDKEQEEKEKLHEKCRAILKTPTLKSQLLEKINEVEKKFSDEQITQLGFKNREEYKKAAFNLHYTKEKQELDEQLLIEQKRARRELIKIVK